MKALLICFLALGLSFASGKSLAGPRMAKDGAKVFIIESKEKPAKVLPAAKASEGEGVMMRMPNLDAQSVLSVPSEPTKKSSTKQVFDKRMKSRAKSEKKLERSSIKFTRAKIQGALRMPRVNFTRVGPAVDIREEMPDLDFNSKTLTDSGF